MSLSATPGSTVSCTMNLPQPARGVVRWEVLDNLGNIVADGQQPPTGTLVAVAFVMPSNIVVPLDGSEYVLRASDGTSMATDGIRIVSALDPANAYNGEVAYVQGRAFVDVLVRDQPVTDVTVAVFSADGSVILPSTEVVGDPSRIGIAYAYRADLGILDTRTSSTYGTGTIVWDFVNEAGMPDQDIHAFWTITPYSSGFIAAIRKLVDRARAGDANPYLDIKPSDLANALVRGMEYVMESPPMMTPFALDAMPISLRDYIVKAAAVDLLRAQYLAEGMSAMDMAGEGTQLTVDRSQYIDGLAQQIAGDLQGLPQAKKAWQQQGMPMGGQVIPGRRPIGVLAITSGLYSNFPIRPLGFDPLSGGYSFVRLQQLAMMQSIGYG